MSKERPILFSGPMVRAILEGHKTQTRRVVKNLIGYDDVVRLGLDLRTGRDTFIPLAVGKKASSFVCPYGQPGDRLWVRETFIPDMGGMGLRYKADGIGFAQPKRWKPSIHMPRCASRILLEIVAVRVERLQDISEADALAEGIQGTDWAAKVGDRPLTPYYPVGDGKWNIHPEKAFAHLWDALNGKPVPSIKIGKRTVWANTNPNSWAANPWVWVVEFKVVTS